MGFSRSSRDRTRRRILGGALALSSSGWWTARGAARERTAPNSIDLGAFLVTVDTSRARVRLVMGVIVAFEDEAAASRARSALVSARLRDAVGSALRDVRGRSGGTDSVVDADRVRDRLLPRIQAVAPDAAGLTVEVLGETAVLRD
ncbi:hypothetical protein JQC91_05160 [Jannaschia sp. Os4]|uniref:hypothetical protein n=1 Tax=Jannaschia sp. Os4 TaxID=2807617 RepID=UPI00193A42AC|nr:hypothetical protein [Jannaschia sp. Os4]MBM2575688.1 hypothetical protein [Jannaschia sp. Os4]